MAKQTLKVLVACGSGVATSTIASVAVQKIADEAKIPVTLYKGTITEVPAKQDTVDLVLTTANYRNPLNKPHMSVFGLISGVGKAQTAKKLAALMTEIYNAD